MSAKQLSIWEACESSLFPIIMAIMENTQASCWRPIMNTWTHINRMGYWVHCSFSKHRSFLRTMMQLSHWVVCILNSSCSRNRVVETEVPKQQTTWTFFMHDIIQRAKQLHIQLLLRQKGKTSSISCTSVPRQSSGHWLSPHRPLHGR